jgi:ATP-binding cassette subfamily B (MDR/TAP) protein 1
MNSSSKSGKLVGKSEKKDNTSEKEKNKVKIAPLALCFSQATTSDIIYMISGSIGGIGMGAAMPFFNIIFGQLLNKLNSDSSGDDFQKAINNLCIIFIYIAVATIFAGYIQVYCWSVAGERQSQKFRMKYVNAILSQEVRLSFWTLFWMFLDSLLSCY